LHNLYLFFQNNLTTTKNRDYYNSIPIPISSPIPISIPTEIIETKTNVENKIINSNDVNSDFTSQMKYELNDFISKINN
jgi:hypothetical protein